MVCVSSEAESQAVARRGENTPDLLALRSDVDLREQIESLVKAGSRARSWHVSAQVCEQLLRERQEEQPGRDLTLCATRCYKPTLRSIQQNGRKAMESTYCKHLFTL